MFESSLIAVGLFTLVLGLIWRWGDARKIRRSVKLGWNTGEPPVDKPILVREYAENMDDGWAVMIRRGDRVYTSNGSSMPIKNITGWLEIVE